jgi:hypothetical protein
MQQSQQVNENIKKPTLLRETKDKDFIPSSGSKIERSMSLRTSVRPLSSYNRNDSDVNLSFS